VTYISVEKARSGGGSGRTGKVTFAAIEPLMAKHCVSCHAARPSNTAFGAAPLGLVFDSYEHVRMLAPRIKKVAVDAEIMPLGNATGMTSDEREQLGRWIAQGTPR
jgi:uncharacterized membrane protein